MKKFLILFFILLFVGCATTSDMTRLKQKVADLEEMVLMIGTQGAGASFYPFSAGLIGGEVGKLDKITSLADKDTAIGILQDSATYATDNQGNAFIPYTHDSGASLGDNVPYIIDSGDVGTDWELLTGVFNGIWSYGDIFGFIDIIADDNSLSALQCKGSINKLNGAETTTLPAATVGMNTILYSDDDTVKTIDPNGTDHIWLNGVDNGEGNSIDSPGAVGDYIVLIAFSANNWYSVGQGGTWIDTP